MKKQILKISVVLLLIVTLTMTNFITLGLGIASIAASPVDVSTNNKNVQFGVYFKNANGGKTDNIEQPLNATDVKLYMQLEVLQEGYFNGEIHLNKANFEIVDCANNYINKIESNTITLNQINAGQVVELELAIKPIKDDKLDLTVLNMKSTFTLEGTYVYGEQKQSTVKTDKEVVLKLINNNNSKDKLVNNIEVVTNKVLNINNEEKRVLQLSINAGLKDNSYPIKNINLEVSVPTIDEEHPEIEKIIKTNTMTEWNYNYDGTKVNIDMSNEAKPENDNKILWKKQGNESVLLTYIYDKDAKIEGENIKLLTKLVLQDGTEITADNMQVLIDGEEKDSVIVANVENNENSIFKGKLYAGIDREFSVKTKIDVNLSNVQKINVSEKVSLYKGTDFEQESSMYYVSSSISKSSLFNLLSEDGTLEILNSGTLIANITKDSTVDENGNIIVKYPDGIKEITIKISGTIKTGTLEINHNKVIKAEDKTTIQKATLISTTVEGSYDTRTGENLTDQIIGKINNSESSIELKESQTSAKLELNKDSLSTITENKGVEIKAILKTNDESYELFKNPTIQIELPEEVEDVKVNSINKIYADEFSVQPSMNTVNGKKVITLNLTGEQTSYKDKAIEGAMFIINADLTLNKKATNANKNIIMTYTNQNASQVDEIKQEQKEIKIVSPKGMIAINNIGELNVQTIGSEETKNVLLAKGKETKNVKVESEIINNIDSPIGNVTILGFFATDGKVIVNESEQQNNLGAIIKSNITLESGEGKTIKVYYTENENATSDVSNVSNAWKENIQDGAKVRKYLIVIDNMNNADSIKFSYDMEIPANLEYNMQAYNGYEVGYRNESTGVTENIKSTQLLLETGKGPVLEGKMIASVGTNEITSGSNVKAGEVIKYTVEVKNIGSEEAKDVKVIGKIPTGTVYVEPDGDYEYIGAAYYKEIEKEKHEIVVGNIEAGKSVNVSYEVRVKSDVADGTIAENECQMVYGEVTKAIGKISNILKIGDIRVTLKRVTDRKIPTYEANTVKYMAIIENISNDVKNDIKIKTNLSEGVTVDQLTLITGLEKLDLSKGTATTISDNLSEPTEEFVENSETQNIKLNEEEIAYASEINIGEIKPGENKVLSYVLMINEPKKVEEKMYMSVIAQDGADIYRSNAISDTVNMFKASASMTSNKDGYLEFGDEIEYVINVKNESAIQLPSVEIADSIPSELGIQSVEANGEDVEVLSNNVIIVKDVDAGEDINVKIKALVDYSESLTEAKVISNKATVTVSDKLLAETQELTNIIDPKSTDVPNTPDNPNGNGGNGDNNGNNNQGNNTNPGTEPSVKTYNISGKVWLDKDENGEFAETDSVMQGVTVKLLNVQANTIAKNDNNEDIQATTDDKGIYLLSNIPEGKYIVVFEYDNSKYKLTTYQKEGIAESNNSNVIVKRLNLNGEEKEYAVTDEITIDKNNVANINMGLAQAKIFDLKLEKVVSKIIVQNEKGTYTYNFNDDILAKVEIDKKLANSTNVIVEYKIRVTNVGELAGYVKKVADYMPSEFKFSSELNKDWYIQNGTLYSTSLANNEIEPGETKELVLTLTDAVSENNMGLINNQAEIYESYNEAGISDVNSVSGNRNQGENDLGQADVILGIKTGKTVVFIGLTISIIVVLGVGILWINKKVLGKEII